MNTKKDGEKHPGALAAKRKKKATNGKRVGKSKAYKANNQLNRRVK